MKLQTIFSVKHFLRRILNYRQAARSIFIACLLSSFSVSAGLKIALLEVEQPRAFGYQIGDKFERNVLLRLNPPYALQVSSLPKQGRLTEFLSIESPEIDFQMIEGVPQYRIKLRYQITNIKPQLGDIGVPSHVFLYSDAHQENAETSNILIPAFRIAVANLTTADELHIQPDRKPQLIAHSSSKVWIYFCLFLISLSGLVYFKWGLPFLNKTRPFTQAYKILNKPLYRRASGETYQKILETTHHAFNETANKTVFVEKLDEFFDQHSEFIAIRASIEEFFNYSREYFFQLNGREQNEQLSATQLIDLVQQCRDIENGDR